MDELERRVRAARPVSGRRDLPLTDRAKRELGSLLLEGPLPETPRVEKRARRPRAVALLMMATVFAVVVGVASVLPLLHPQSTYAATPEMLRVTPMHDMSPADVLMPLAEQREAGSAQPAPKAFTINVQAWTLATDVDGDGEAQSSAIVPQNYEITVDSDGSRHQRFTAAEPQTRFGSPAPLKSGPPAGTVLSEQSWKPGEYLALYPESAPNVSAKYAAFFNSVIQSDAPPTAAAVLSELNSLLLEQKLSPNQEGALLGYLATLPDLKLVGKVTDRLGRAGVAFGATDPNRPEYEYRVVISPSNGRILSTETIYTGHDRTDIPSPAVVQYDSWK